MYWAFAVSLKSLLLWKIIELAICFGLIYFRCSGECLLVENQTWGSSHDMFCLSCSNQTWAFNYKLAPAICWIAVGFNFNIIHKLRISISSFILKTQERYASEIRLISNPVISSKVSKQLKDEDVLRLINSFNSHM